MNKEKEEKLAEISARITEVIEYLGETSNSFAIKLGYQRAQTIYDIQKMKSAPSFDFFQRFSNAGFSVLINLDWLLTGEGTMLREEVKSEEPQPVQSKPDESLLRDMFQSLQEEKKEKEKKIEKLTEELRAMERKVGKLEAELEHAAALGSRTADNASTVRRSSQSKASAHSASAHSNE